MEQHALPEARIFSNQELEQLVQILNSYGTLNAKSEALLNHLIGLHRTQQLSFSKTELKIIGDVLDEYSAIREFVALINSKQSIN